MTFGHAQTTETGKAGYLPTGLGRRGQRGHITTFPSTSEITGNTKVSLTNPEAVVGQIVSAKKNEKGNYVLEVKPLPEHSVSETGANIHVAGTVGWAEILPGLTIEDPDGNLQQLRGTVDIRYINPFSSKKKRGKTGKPLTSEDLRKAADKL